MVAARVVDVERLPGHFEKEHRFGLFHLGQAFGELHEGLRGVEGMDGVAKSHQVICVNYKLY